jgi:hypothetical protein
MAITVSQIDGATASMKNIVDTCEQLRDLLFKAKGYANAGWVIDIGTPGNPATVPVPLATQQAMIAQYDTLKAQLVTLFNQLP